MNTIFDQNSTQRTAVIVVSRPTEFIAFGLADDDTIAVDIALIGNRKPEVTINGCSLINNSNQSIEIQGTVPYRICNNQVGATKTNNQRFIIDRAGEYVLTYTGSGFGEAVLVATDVSRESVEYFHNNCGAGGVIVPVEYCPSLAITCDNVTGYGYHINDPKDPAATVEIAACDDPAVDSIWIYPTAGPGHTFKYLDCDGTLVGYANNQSKCAAQYDCGCQDSSIGSPTIVNNFSPTTNVEVNQPTKAVVAAQISEDGEVSITNADGSVVKSNPIPTC